MTVTVRHRIYRDARVVITMNDAGMSYYVRLANTAERFQPRPSTPTTDRHRFWQDAVDSIHPRDREAVALFVGIK